MSDEAERDLHIEFTATIAHIAIMGPPESIIPMLAAQTEVEQLRAELDRLTADEIIGRYYMARGRNKKLTLRQYLKDIQTPLSEGYIRKRKVAYDKRHKKRKGR